MVLPSLVLENEEGKKEISIQEHTEPNNTNSESTNEFRKIEEFLTNKTQEMIGNLQKELEGNLTQKISKEIENQLKQRAILTKVEEQTETDKLLTDVLNLARQGYKYKL